MSRAIKLDNSDMERGEFVYLGSKIKIDGDIRCLTNSQKQDQHLPISTTFGKQHQSAPTQRSEYSKVTS
jgi:hypothetical protein